MISFCSPSSLTSSPFKNTVFWYRFYSSKIRRVLKIVQRKCNFNLSEDVAELFKTMFPDRLIKTTKLNQQSCLTFALFGINPYAKSIVIKKVQKSSYYTFPMKCLIRNFKNVRIQMAIILRFFMIKNYNLLTSIWHLLTFLMIICPLFFLCF